MRLRTRNAASSVLVIALSLIGATNRLAAEEPSPPFIERLEEQPAGGHPRILSDVEEPIEQWRLVPNFRDDRKSFPSEIWADVKSLTSWQSLGWIAAGSGFAAYSDRNWDDDVRRRTAAHPRRWGGFNNVFDVVGHPATHLTAAGVYYGVSLALDDVEGWQFSRAMLHSLILTDVSVAALKYSFDTTRPNGKRRGFPSGHTASSFAAAAVIETNHGWLAGTGAYLAAGLVGWHRIDNRNHDLSDVLFGAAMGMAIGKAVSSRHLQRWERIRMSTYIEPENGVSGLMFETRF